MCQDFVDILKKIELDISILGKLEDEIKLGIYNGDKNSWRYKLYKNSTEGTLTIFQKI